MSPFCPGKSGSATVFETDGQVGHTASLSPQETEVLPDVAAVTAWATQADLVIPSNVLEALGKLTGVSFVALRFVAPPGAGVTPTLRVAMVGAPPLLPLGLIQAGSSNLLVTAWMIGSGQASAIGDVQVAISPSALAWNAGAQASNYEDLRSTALSSGLDTFLVEAVSQAAFAENISIAQGAAFIDGVVTTYFDRAAAYGDGAFDSAQCITTATPLLASSATVAAVCPRAALGVVDPTPACTESPGPGQIDPQDLRCGAGADDLALALSGLTPSTTWLTRQSMLIPGDSSGADPYLQFQPPSAQSPVLVATSVSTTDCGDAGSSSSSSGSVSSSGASTSSGMMSSGSGPGQSIGDGLDVGGDIIDALADADDSTNCSCSGTEPTASDSSDSGACSGSSDASSGGCSGSSSSTDDSSSSGSCSSGSSDSSSDSCSSGSSSSSDSCSSGGGGSGDSCSGSGGGGGSFDCSIASPRRVRLPKLSILLMMALAVAAPLRRRGRKSRARPRDAHPAERG